MAKLLLAVVALFAAVALVSATRPLSNPYTVKGCVYCDTCRTGFETPISDHIAGAIVRVQCLDRHSLKMLFSATAVTDKNGEYKITVPEDQGDALCDSLLVSSPRPECSRVDPGRDRSRLVLTSNNGMVSRERYANSLGYVQDYSSPKCPKVLAQYHIYDAEDLS